MKKRIAYPSIRRMNNGARAELVEKLEAQREKLTADIESELAQIAKLTGKPELAIRETGKVGSAPNDNGYRVRKLTELKKGMPKDALKM